MAELPEELIIQILQWSPVKTLLRFRGLSKSIRGIIDSRGFIKSHILNTTSDDRTRKKPIFREGHDDDDDSTIAKFLVFNIDDGSKQLFYIADGFPTELQDLPSYQFFAHYDGLVLLGKDLYRLGVWNPSTRKYRKLPVLPKVWADGQGPVSYGITGLGFGYDSSTDDYKVVLIKEVTFHKYKSYKHELWIWILGFRSCNWRKIETLPFDEYRVVPGFMNCFVDGAFHFLCEGGIILTFDVAKETFCQVPLPSFGQTKGSLSDLQVFEVCLCIRLFCWSKEEDRMELYVRKKDGVEFSWTKVFSNTNTKFATFNGELLEYSKKGDKIFMLGDRNTVLYSYDFNGKSLHRIDIGDIRSSNIIYYIESLVSVDYQEQKDKKKRKAPSNIRKARKQVFSFETTI